MNDRRFALIGAAGFIAPRHMKAIKETGNTLVAAADPHDSVGIIDSFFPECRYFNEIERFDRHLEKLRRQDSKVDYVSICTPNYLHDAHVRLALRLRAHAICEKPLVINPWNLDALQEIEAEAGFRIYNILQLRLLPGLVELKKKLDSETNRKKVDVVLTYITRRGTWYATSWKGDEKKSGGVAMNIGVHFFDLLLWLFGASIRNEVHYTSDQTMAGFLDLEWANVRWFLSVDGATLPADTKKAGKFAFRSLQMDGEEIEFSDGFTDLHTRVYESILAGNGFFIKDSRPAIELVYDIRHRTTTNTPQNRMHPFLNS